MQRGSTRTLRSNIKNNPSDVAVKGESSEAEPERQHAFAGRLRERARPPTRQNPATNGAVSGKPNDAVKVESKAKEEREAVQKGLKQERLEMPDPEPKHRRVSNGSNGRNNERGMPQTPQGLITLAKGISERRDSLQPPDVFLRWVAGADVEADVSLAPVTWSSDVEMLAQAGDYYICNPSVTDSPRLRQLEREFVLDHWELFHADRWHGQPSLSDWCRLVNVIEHEQDARQAISSIIGGKTPGHGTLACVHVPRSASNDVGCPVSLEQPEIVGYVHVVRTGSGFLDISHLKVGRAHQRRGLGSLLVAGAVRSATRLAWDVRTLRVVTVSRNPLAVLLYRALGFIHVGSVAERVCTGADGSAEWQKMRRPFHDCTPDAFADAVESRARTALQRSEATAPAEPTLLSSLGVNAT